MSDFLSAAILLMQALIDATAILLFFVKPLRACVFNNKKKKEADEKKENNRDEAMRCTLRNIITEFYYAHRSSGCAHQYEYENASKVYLAYKELGGNSFVDKIWEDIKGWNVLP